MTLDTENPGDVAGWVADAKFQVRAAQVVTPDGGTEIRIRDDAHSRLEDAVKVGPEEILELRGLLAPTASRSTCISSSAATRPGVVQRDLADGDGER